MRDLIHTESLLRRMASCAAMGCAAVALAGPAAAGSCLDEVLGVAARYGVSTDPPTAGPGANSDVTAEDLARSGGVIEPPPIKDKSVIAPPRATRYGMPTLPDVVPESSDSKRMTLQAILTAARAEAERGDEAGCRAALAKAPEILERGS